MTNPTTGRSQRRHTHTRITRTGLGCARPAPLRSRRPGGAGRIPRGGPIADPLVDWWFCDRPPVITARSSCCCSPLCILSSASPSDNAVSRGLRRPRRCRAHRLRLLARCRRHRPLRRPRRVVRPAEPRRCSTAKPRRFGPPHASELRTRRGLEPFHRPPVARERFRLTGERSSIEAEEYGHGDEAPWPHTVPSGDGPLRGGLRPHAAVGLRALHCAADHLAQLAQRR